MEALSAAMQALCMSAYSGGILDQAGCYSGAQLYEQKSAIAPREASFSASTQRGTLEHLNRHHKKHTPSLKQGFACARQENKKPTRETIYFPPVFHRDRAPMRCPLIQPGVHFPWTRKSIKCPCGSWK